MNEAFSRTAMLLGEDGVAALQTKHVAVFGLGGVGSFCAEALARAGVGALTLVDDDTVAESNLNRQLVALRSTLGQPKAQVMAGRIGDINPQCRLTVLVQRYTPETRETFFAQPLDFVADCIDSVACKTDLIATAISREIPILSAMGTGNKLDPSKLVLTDLAETSVCPLARVMRNECRKRGVKHLKVVYSREPALTPIPDPEAPDGGTPADATRPGGPRRATPGSTAFVPSVAGLILAGEVIKDLAGYKRK